MENKKSRITRYIITLLYVFLCTSYAHAGSADTTSPIYGRHYIKAQFPGDVEMYLKIKTRYPDLARENDIVGTVMVRFLILENGRISNITILRDIGGGCGTEAKRVVQNMPPWAPATYKGKPVKSVHTIPIVFRLE